MVKELIYLNIVIFLLAGCDDSSVGQEHHMMMGGMMGNIEIKGNRPPPETNTRYIKGYQQAVITCSQCHVMPHPNQHSRAEWPGVIARMEEHIRTYNKVMPDAEELNSINNYYAANSN